MPAHEKKTSWNTRLITVAIALIGWNLIETVNTGKQVAELKTSLLDSVKAGEAADAVLASQAADHETRIRALEHFLKDAEPDNSVSLRVPGPE